MSSKGDLNAGHVIFHGPVEEAAGYFEGLGFRCPERKGVADFLQEVTSKKVHSTFTLTPCKLRIL